ncbi:MAG: DUF424 family protein [Candidatus Aenigmarchaeota archaeon]|nr:DUF424 family protein [Candidatus Aenigmarchaeota archaeon]
MSFVIKTHKTEKGIIVAVCDEDIAGRVFEENGLVLDIDRDFFCDVLITKTELLEILKDAHTANICGNKAVDFLVENNILEDAHVKTIAGVKYAMMF